MSDVHQPDHWVSQVGLSFLGQRAVVRGRDLHRDLQDKTWLEIFLFGLTGRDFSNEDVRLLNYIWVSTSYPDVRIWCNRVAALAGSARSTASLAMSAALAVTEAELYGSKPALHVMDFLWRTKLSIEAGNDLSSVIERELQMNKYIFGFGRPITSTDERVPHFAQFLFDNNRLSGSFVQLVFAVDDYLKSSRKIQMNIAALYAGACADIGFKPQEFYWYMTMIVFGGYGPCYVDAVTQKEGSFLPIRCSQLKYTGTRRRRWSDGVPY